MNVNLFLQTLNMFSLSYPPDLALLLYCWIENNSNFKLVNNIEFWFLSDVRLIREIFEPRPELSFSTCGYLHFLSVYVQECTYKLFPIAASILVHLIRLGTSLYLPYDNHRVKYFSNPKASTSEHFSRVNSSNDPQKQKIVKKPLANPRHLRRTAKPGGFGVPDFSSPTS